ncbi:DNA-3-methyladenine glycosylase II [Deinococcus metalli]|uniref:DNA-3-methyladenine glycosylase II n=1 Tax=Deinococcus metalli TaxID=1141878 RepID=A0A7W8NPV9_9DEIO|nr:DNA-3-methyladenine glycosylase 2 family protein [Deinococcus metalli]MBB5378364.1 DNA-3-methyladenine glycosylase II [Deinococcus metalli]GHF59438.1 DNA-3-methyladenine glycosylase 2 family protein [Deinococcus metalli]
MSAAATLPVTPPFNFGLTLAFLNGFPPMQGEQGTGGELRKATRLAGQTVGFVVRAADGELDVTLHPERTLDAGQVQALHERIAFFLGTDVELDAFYALAEKDTALRPVLRDIYGFHQPRFLTPFEAACWAILTQRQPLAQARHMKLALADAHGGAWDGLPAFPEPADLAELNAAAFQALVPNERKARALHAVTRAFQGVSTADLAAAPYGEVREWLLGIHGIGEWSALFVLLRGLGRTERKDLSPDSPLMKELLRAARPVYGELTPQDLLTIADGYGEQRGQWAISLRSRAALVPHEERVA